MNKKRAYRSQGRGPWTHKFSGSPCPKVTDVIGAVKSVFPQLRAGKPAQPATLVDRPKGDRHELSGPGMDGGMDDARI